MTHKELPEEIQSFIGPYVDSIELLWVLLLLHKQPEKAWTIEEIEKELRSTSSAIERRLNDLYERKILLKQSDGGHRFSPATAEIAEAINRVAAYNLTHASRLIDFIFSRSHDNIKNFAEAFRIKKD